MPEPPSVPDPPPVSGPETINQKLNTGRSRSETMLDLAWLAILGTVIMLVLAVITGYSLFRWIAGILTVIAVILSVILPSIADRSQKR